MSSNRGIVVVPPEIIRSWGASNYNNPETRGMGLAVFCIVLGVLSLVVVVARLYARLMVIRQVGADDVMVIIAKGFAIAFLVAASINVFNYHDRHLIDLSLFKLKDHLKLTFIGQLISIPAQGAVKLAVLLFYRRILQGSPRRIFRYCNSALMAFVTLYTIASIPLLILVCRPTEAFWMYTSLSPIYKKKYQCFSLRNALIHPAVMSLVSDILITILPMFFLYDLQLPRRQKYALAVLFGLGFIVCAAALVRLVFIIVTLFVTYDTTWDGYYIWTSMSIELELAVICASAPALKPLFKKYFDISISRYSRRTPKNTNPTQGKTSDYELSPKHPEEYHRI